MLYKRAWKLDYSSDDWEDIKYAIEATYPNLGVGAGMGVVTCEQVGELSEAGNIYSKACVDATEDESSSSSTLSSWAIAVIVVLCVLLLIAIVYVISIKKKYKDAQLLGNTTGTGEVQLS